MTKVQQRLEVNKEVDDKSPADAGIQTSEVVQSREARTIFFDLDRYQLTANTSKWSLCTLPYCTIFLTYEITGVLGLKVFLRKVLLEVYHYIFRSTSMVCYVSVEGMSGQQRRLAQ